MPSNPSRRRIIVTLLTIPLLGISLEKPAPRNKHSVPVELANLLKSHSIARLLGKRFYGAHGTVAQNIRERKELIALNEVILASTLTEKQFLHLNDRQLLKQISTQIQQEFYDENILKVEGWVLSYTEVRLCALNYLIFV